MEAWSSMVFLAMYCGGGGPYSIPDLLRVCDWIHRAIPSRAELEAALNFLLAAGLVKQQDEGFTVPQPQFAAFDAFRKTRRRDRFESVRLYFRGLPEVGDTRAVVELTESDFRLDLEKYREQSNA